MVRRRKMLARRLLADLLRPTMTLGDAVTEPGNPQSGDTKDVSVPAKFDAFVSYSRKDNTFAKKLHKNLERYLAGTDVNYRIEIYPGTGHGFVFPSRPGIYHNASAERHWERLLALYSRCL